MLTYPQHPGATQAEMEAAISQTTHVTPGNMNHHPGVAKVLTKFGAPGGVLSTDYAYGCTVSRTGVGVYVLTFTVAFSNANYVILPGGFNTGAADGSYNVVTAQSTTACTISCFNSVGAAQDQTAVYVGIFGDQ